MDTVVEVGNPIELKTSNNIISEIITARKIIITSLKLNMPGTKIPLRAISIIPLENSAPTKIPRLATIIIVRNDTALEPIAEFKKFTASLLTPTTRSIIAKMPKTTSITIYICSISVFKVKGEILFALMELVGLQNNYLIVRQPHDDLCLSVALYLKKAS